MKDKIASNYSAHTASQFLISNLHQDRQDLINFERNKSKFIEENLSTQDAELTLEQKEELFSKLHKILGETVFSPYLKIITSGRNESFHIVVSVDKSAGYEQKRRFIIMGLRNKNIQAEISNFDQESEETIDRGNFIVRIKKSGMSEYAVYEFKDEDNNCPPGTKKKQFDGSNFADSVGEESVKLGEKLYESLASKLSSDQLNILLPSISRIDPENYMDDSMIELIKLLRNLLSLDDRYSTSDVKSILGYLYTINPENTESVKKCVPM